VVSWRLRLGDGQVVQTEESLDTGLRAYEPCKQRATQSIPRRRPTSLKYERSSIACMQRIVCRCCCCCYAVGEWIYVAFAS